MQQHRNLASLLTGAILFSLLVLATPAVADLDTIQESFANRESALLQDLRVEHVTALSEYIAANPEAEDLEDALIAWLDTSMQATLFSEARSAAAAYRAAFPDGAHAKRVLTLQFMSLLQDEQLPTDAAVSEARSLITETNTGQAADAAQELQMRLSLGEFLIDRDRIDLALDELNALLQHPALQGDPRFRAHVERTRDYAQGIGQPFDDFAVQDVNGDPLSVGRYKGQVVLIEFWATWCAPCIHELPELTKLYADYNPKGLEVIGISLDANRNAFDAFMKQWKLPWPQYVDAAGPYNPVAKQYGITHIPRSFLVDREGNLYRRDLRGEELEQAVAKLIASPAL